MHSNNRNKIKIFIRRADKGNIYVILDEMYYSKKIQYLIDDRSKLAKLNKNATDILKISVNKVITFINADVGF